LGRRGSQASAPPPQGNKKLNKIYKILIPKIKILFNVVASVFDIENTTVSLSAEVFLNGSKVSL
jgi:hypothetical protein